MAHILVDTNILIRASQPHHDLYAIANRAVQRLPQLGWDLVITPQNLIELWAVGTRLVEHNGLGLSVSWAAAELERVKSMFMLLPDTPAIYPAWERLVARFQVCGKSAHDARLVAAMQAHGITAILTFDRTGFSRYPGIEIFHPADVVAGA
jgi:predicted nucleic acid-binding protein